MSPYSMNDPDTLLSGSGGNLLRDRQNPMHPTGFQAMSLQYRLRRWKEESSVYIRHADSKTGLPSKLT